MTIRDGIPNLDAEDDEDLYAYAQTFRQLALYCDLQRDARMRRRAGQIEDAQILERAADKIHSSLPEWARW